MQKIEKNNKLCCGADRICPERRKWWLKRYQEHSFWRLFVPWNIRSHDGTFVLRTIRFLEHSFPGPFVPCNFRFRDRSFPGTFVPENE